MNASFVLHSLLAKKATPDSVLTSAAAQCVQKVSKNTKIFYLQ